MWYPFNSSFSFYLISAGMTTISNRRNRGGSLILNDGCHPYLLDPFLVSERALVSLYSYFMLIRICSTKYSSFSTNYIFFACSLVKGSTFGIVKM
jgi:hypothetical protein